MLQRPNRPRATNRNREGLADISGAFVVCASIESEELAEIEASRGHVAHVLANGLEFDVLEEPLAVSLPAMTSGDGMTTGFRSSSGIVVAVPLHREEEAAEMPKVIIYFKADDTKNAYAARGNGGAAVHLSRVPVPREYIGHEAAEGYDAAVFARKARFVP